MVAPYRHVGDLTELSDEEIAEIMTMAREWVRDLQAVARPHGFNLGFNLGTAAGAGVADHLHLHIVPRWGGDTNFMTVLSETRVINQALAETRDELLRARARR
jgi:ATP adenylyltransferase